MKGALASAAIAAGLAVAPGAARPEAETGPIVFASDRAAAIAPTEARAVDVRTGRSRRIGVVPVEYDDVVVWAPSGRAFARVTTRHELFVVRPGRSARLVARRLAAIGVGPAWSRSGRRLAYFGRDRGRLSVYVVRADGSGRTRVAARIAHGTDVLRVGGLSWSPSDRRLAIVASRRGRRRLFVLDVRTRRLRRLQTGRGFPSAPDWSPTGRTIAYRAQVPGERSTVRAIDLQTGLVRRVHVGAGVPLWSPDGRSLAIDEKHRLLVLSRGSARLVATHPPLREPPVWSPDSSRLAFRTRRDLVVVDAVARRTRRLLREVRMYEPWTAPAWAAPHRVVYVGDRREPADLDLYVVRPDGSGIRALTRNAVNESEPAWSPDDGWIALTSARGRSATDVYVMTPSGTARRRLVVNGSAPSWSPDGSRLAFSRNDDIWTIGVDGSNPVQLTFGAARDRQPDWSPRGDEIAFSRSVGSLSDNAEIYAVLAGGAEPRRITAESARNVGCVAHLALNPAWSPDGRRLAYELETFGSSQCGPTRGRKVEIYVAGSDGSARAFVTDGGYWDATADDGALSPAWSSDGTEIVFVSSVSDTKPDYDEWSRVGIVPVSGGAFRLITPKAYASYTPDWRS